VVACPPPPPLPSCTHPFPLPSCTHTGALYSTCVVHCDVLPLQMLFLLVLRFPCEIAVGVSVARYLLIAGFALGSLHVSDVVSPVGLLGLFVALCSLACFNMKVGYASVAVHTHLSTPPPLLLVHTRAKHTMAPRTGQTHTA
jgi:hypothetical protein